MAKKKAAAKASAKKSKRDVLVVTSKVKDYIRNKGGKGSMYVASDFPVSLSEAVYDLIDKAIARAQNNRRSTVQPKDV